MTKERIVLIGAGNLAWHLGPALHKAGINIVQVYSRTPEHAGQLADTIDAMAISSLKDILPSSTMILLAVSDDAIPAIISEITPGQQALVHTAGSLPIDVLKEKTSICGVLYPLQTFSKFREVNFKDVPLLIEAGSKEVLTRIMKLSRAISSNVQLADSSQRFNIHLAAVFAGNFVNHFYAIAQQLIKNQGGFNFEILKPLILETARKAVESGNPVESQTGPAVRKNRQIVARHIEMLSANTDWQNLYTFATNSIAKLYFNENLI